MTIKAWAKKYPDINWLSPIEWFRLGGIANLATFDSGFSHHGADWFWRALPKKRLVDHLETYNSHIRYVNLDSFSINSNYSDSDFSQSLVDTLNSFSPPPALIHK